MSDLISRNSQVVVFSIGAFILASLFVLLDNAMSEANNPSTSLIGVAEIDPSDDIEALVPTPVWTVAEANGRYYIGGTFQTIGGETQVGLAAIEVATGQLDPAFRPIVAGGTAEILTLAVSPDSQHLYIGGRFTSINGVSRNRIAKVDAATGAVDATFDPNASAAVESIVVDSSGVFVGGRFLSIGGVPQANLAKVDPMSGALVTGWIGSPNAAVLDLEVEGSDLFVGGNFTQVNGTANAFLVKLDAAGGGVAQDWAPTIAVPDKVISLTVKPDLSMVYAGLAGIANAGGNTVWAHSTTGQRIWQRVASGDIQALEATDSTVYVGTHGEWVFLEPKFLLDGVTPNPSFPVNGYVEDPTNPNAVKREKFFAADAATGSLTAWDPDADSLNGVWELQLGATGLLAGGDFHNIANPTGVTAAGPNVFTPHFTVFPGLGTGNSSPEPLFTVDCAGTACNVDASPSLDDGTIVDYAWDFGDGQVASGVSASALLSDNAVHTISLTLTDDLGASAARREHILIGNGGLDVHPIATSTIDQTSTVLTQSLPSMARKDDVAIAFVSVNDPAVVVSPPTGWSALGDHTVQNLRSFGWYRTLVDGEGGTNQSFALSTTTKASLTLTVVRGADPTTPIDASGASLETVERFGHHAPSVSVGTKVAVLRHWAERSSETTEFFAPAGETTLATSIGVGPAHISSVTSMSVTQLTGIAPVSIAIAEHHGRGALGWTVAIRRAPRVCDGLPATVDLAEGEAPTSGADVIIGTPVDDMITALGGDDVICGGDGNDTINGGPGLDHIFGEDGHDTLFGLDGDDVMEGGPGSDEIVGFGGNDTIRGDEGDDTINGGAGDDTLFGGNGDDRIFGQSGIDFIDSGQGDDFAVGFTGNDTIEGGPGDDELNGGPNDDVVTGGTGNDTIFGLTGDDDVRGNDGDDRVFGQLGNDQVRGGEGNDFLWGNEGNDVLVAASGTNVLNGGPDDDTVTGGTGPDQIFGDGSVLQGGNDVLDGGAGGPDSINGFAGDDSVMSANGVPDTINAGPGNDPCVFDVGIDTVYNCE